MSLQRYKAMLHKKLTFVFIYAEVSYHQISEKQWRLLQPELFSIVQSVEFFSSHAISLPIYLF